MARCVAGGGFGTGMRLASTTGCPVLPEQPLPDRGGKLFEDAGCGCMGDTGGAEVCLEAPLPPGEGEQGVLDQTLCRNSGRTF